MYVKRHAVRRGPKRYVYLRLVQAYRDDEGHVRHRVLRTLGREDELKASGQLEQLAGSFARLDPPLAGTRRDVGPLLLAWHFMRELDLIGTIDSVLPQRGRHKLAVSEVVAALIASRLCSPSPLYDIAGWASGSALQELTGIPPALLNDDRLGRALESFAVYAEHVRGLLAARAIERFGIDAARLHVDLTAVRVAGAYEDSALIAKGWAQGQEVGRQVRALQAASADGVSLYLRPDPGNASELSLVGASLERLLSFARPGMLMVLDSALGQWGPLCQIARAGLSFICPLKVDTGFRERYIKGLGEDALKPLGYVAERERRLPARLRTKYRGALVDWVIADPETGAKRRFRVAYIHSSEEAEETALARERALCKAEELLLRVQRGLGGRYYKTREDVERRVDQIVGAKIRALIDVEVGEADGKPTLAFRRDEKAIEQASATDGVYALATNLPGRLSAARVLAIYKDQQIVERRHRDLKETLKVRPIFLHNDDRVFALVSIVGIARLVFGLMEAQLRGALAQQERFKGGLLPILPEDRLAKPTARNILAAFQGLGLTYTAHGIELDRLTFTQQTILELLRVRVPWSQQGAVAAGNCGKRG